MTLDHARAINDTRYFQRQRQLFIESFCASASNYQAITVEHDNDKQCCADEPWERTYAQFMCVVLSRLTGRSAGDCLAQLQEFRGQPFVVYAKQVA